MQSRALSLMPATNDTLVDAAEVSRRFGAPGLGRSRRGLLRGSNSGAVGRGGWCARGRGTPPHVQECVWSLQHCQPGRAGECAIWKHGRLPRQHGARPRQVCSRWRICDRHIPLTTPVWDLELEQDRRAFQKELAPRGRDSAKFVGVALHCILIATKRCKHRSETWRMNHRVFEEFKKYIIGLPTQGGRLRSSCTACLCDRCARTNHSEPVCLVFSHCNTNACFVPSEPVERCRSEISVGHNNSAFCSLGGLCRLCRTLMQLTSFHVRNFFCKYEVMLNSAHLQKRIAWKRRASLLTLFT